MTVASRAVMMAVMTEARALDMEQEGHWGMSEGPVVEPDPVSVVDAAVLSSSA